MEIPMKMYWMGEDVEDLPREKLVEIIHHLHEQVESTRSILRATIDINRAGLEARQRL